MSLKNPHSAGKQYVKPSFQIKVHQTYQTTGSNFNMKKTDKQPYFTTILNKTRAGPCDRKFHTSVGQSVIHFLYSLRQEVLAWRQRSHNFLHLLEPGEAQPWRARVRLSGSVSCLQLPLKTDSDLRCVSNHIFEAVYTEDIMVVAQTDRKDHLKLFKILQTAEDDVNTGGRNNNQRFI